MGYTVKTNFDQFKGRFAKQNIGAAKYATLAQMQSDMEHLIPKRAEENRTNLRGSVAILPDNSGITYNTAYAKAQFYGVITDKHGGKHPVKHYTQWPGDFPGKRWDLRGKELYGKDWVKAFKGGLTK
ncbi:minor capsid protein [Pediococcus pentosaceus]|uniref:minor capsid protein n=1 Tax=Pediococcus pentosaceus TaxID=1255 RepID=UPI00259B8B8B|nr:minor capsid protein [Pediococcus pentosaceus]WFC01163.1 minor capsid protein [Pediococcus pentosaceus]